MRILKEFFKSPAMILFFGVFAYWLFFRPKPSTLFNQGLTFKEFDDSGSTISDEMAIQQAEILHKAMSKWFGTDEQRIYNIFKGLTKPNFNKIYNKFGTRPYLDIFGVATTESLGENINLMGWLSYELSSKELRKLKNLAPEVFK